MDYRFDLCALGEMIVDCSLVGTSDSGSPLFEGNPGGAPCNVAACLAKLGLKSTYIGKLGDDVMGRFFFRSLSPIGVDDSGVILDKEHNTTLTFVSVDETGDRSFQFYRDNTADVRLYESDVKKDVIAASRVFHFGTLSMTDPVTRQTTLSAARYAAVNGLIVSFDPNYRSNIWPSAEEARELISLSLELSDIAKVSEEELWLLADECEDVRETGESIRKKYGVQILLVTLGAGGAYCFMNGTVLFRSAYDVKTVDTTGAGDAFMGGFLYSFLMLGKQISEVSVKEMEKCLAFANATGSLTTTKPGAISALPQLQEVMDCVKNGKQISPEE